YAEEALATKRHKSHKKGRTRIGRSTLRIHFEPYVPFCGSLFLDEIPVTESNLVSIGLRAKTGRAIAVVLGGSIYTPVVLLKTEIKLVDPKVPDTAQPYHAVMDLPWEESQRAARKYAVAIERTAKKALAKLIEE